MLRAFAFRAAQFSEHQYMELHQGPNFIIGPNSSQRQLVLDLIVDCTKTATLPLTSARVQNSYIICKYEVAGTLRTEIKSKISTQLQLQSDSVTLFVCTYALHEESQYKVILIKNATDSSQEHGEHFVCISKVSTEPGQALINQSLGTDKMKQLATYIEKLCSPSGNEQIRTYLGCCSDQCSDSPDRTKDVLELLSRSQRCVETLRFSQNRQSTISEKDYPMLFADLGSSKINQEQEKNDFKTLISPLTRTFEKVVNDGNCTINVTPASNEQTPHFVQEHIVEAKLLSLSVNNKALQTLFLKDPSTTFDSSMVERMRDLLFMHEDKVILLTSQRSSIVNPCTVPRTSVCRRRRSTPYTDHFLVSVLDQSRHFVSNEEIKKIMFAESVFIVEGITDKVVMEVLFDIIKQDNPHVWGILEEEAKQAENEIKLERLKAFRSQVYHFISSMQIIKQDGHKDKRKYEDLCSKLQVPCLFLLDRNVFVTDDKGQSDNTSGAACSTANSCKAGNTCRGRITAMVEDMVNSSRNEKDKNYLQDILKTLIKNETSKNSNMKLLTNTLKQKIEAEHEHRKDINMTKISRAYTSQWGKVGFPTIQIAGDEFWNKPEHAKLKECISNLNSPNLETLSQMYRHLGHFHTNMISPMPKEIISKTFKEHCLPPLQPNDFVRLEKELRIKNIFIWISGNLEHVINNAIMQDPEKNLPIAFEIWDQFPILKPKKETERYGKRALTNASPEQLQKLWMCLLEDKEIRRLLSFFVDMALKYQID